jgi:CRP/FNR family transcriptional regulator, cyclic AMP receptor protein
MKEDRLSAALLAEMAPMGKTRSFRKNAILINEGEQGNALYIVLQGRLLAYASSEQGRDVILGEYGPGEYVGELALDGGPRAASVKTLEATSCCVIPAPELSDVLAMHPEFAVHLIGKLSRMARRATEQVKSLALQDVYGRLARALMELSDDAGDADGDRVVRDRLTQQDLADRIGSSREMVNRVLKDLALGGYVSLRDGRYVIQRKLPAAR